MKLTIEIPVELKDTIDLTYSAISLFDIEKIMEAIKNGEEAKDTDENEDYKKGLDDAWERARKIACDKSQNGYSLYTLREIFGTASICDIFSNFSASEAIQKIKEYEEKQIAEDIKVGDEVVDECGIRFVVVTDEPTSDGCVSLLSNYYQTTQLYPIKKLRKTGRHFDQVAEVVEQLKEGQDETK